MRLKTKIITYVSIVLLFVLAIAFIVFLVIQPNRLEKPGRSTMLKEPEVLCMK